MNDYVFLLIYSRFKIATMISKTAGMKVRLYVTTLHETKKSVETVAVKIQNAPFGYGEYLIGHAILKKVIISFTMQIQVIGLQRKVHFSFNKNTVPNQN